MTRRFIHGALRTGALGTLGAVCGFALSCVLASVLTAVDMLVFGADEPAQALGMVWVIVLMPLMVLSGFVVGIVHGLTT